MFYDVIITFKEGTNQGEAKRNFAQLSLPNSSEYNGTYIFNKLSLGAINQ